MQEQYEEVTVVCVFLLFCSVLKMPQKKGIKRSKRNLGLLDMLVPTAVQKQTKKMTYCEKDLVLASLLKSIVAL